MTRFHMLLVAFLLAGTAQSAAAQAFVPPRPQTVNLSGPRVGVTLLSEGVVRSLEERAIHLEPVISQFGWQVEKQFFSASSGLTAVTELVFLLGGLEQSVVVPSVSWLVGVRTGNGTEFGIGPNVTPAGTALAIAGGVTFRAGPMNVPVNVAVVPAKVGTRVSVLTGFNLRRP
jgi:hypothetical protein